ncbi:16S rRNA (guanine(527)-N(7))-methyltransferase RsmG [Lachnospiraceae bacterium OttesenSCG-928-D06]|nr:16S rRNA (guanine(527)-N(7))-methyltransferase RsmG [Lachnospiraceae bacterium OttesenSCG-928-D06]
MNQYNTEQFEKDLSELGIVLNDNQIKQFIKYYEILTKWNEVMNLTAITDYDEVMKKHFIDSLSLNKTIVLSEKKTLIDVGTGAGFPGIPLKIAFPELQITLLDSLRKRVNFLDEVIKELQLTGIKTVHGRAEDYAKEKGFRESFDMSVSRAVANLSTLTEYCIPFVKVGGVFVSYKSDQVEEEIKNASNAIHILGGDKIQQTEFILPNSEIHRNIIVIKKKKITGAKYPRKAGLPSKEPLI